jgi:protein arginine N-methyltransferase 5
MRGATRFGLHCGPIHSGGEDQEGGAKYLALEDALHLVRCSGSDFACLPLHDQVFCNASLAPGRPRQDQLDVLDSLGELQLRDVITAEDTAAVRLLKLLSSTGAWSRHIVGLATGDVWDERLRAQMSRAAHLGLPAVVVPSPPAAPGSALHAAGIIRSFLAASSGTAVWVRCDATSAEDYARYNNLRDALGLNEVAVEVAGADGSTKWREPLSDCLGSAVRGGKVHVYLTLPAIRGEQDGTTPISRLCLASWLGESVQAFCCRAPMSAGNCAPADLPEWGSHCACSRLPVEEFETRLMCHRAVPVIPFGTFEEMTRGIDACCMTAGRLEGANRHAGRNFFQATEDVIQLPLQPLGDHLPSGVYDTFERDTPKYEAYGRALLGVFLDWKKKNCLRQSEGKCTTTAGRNDRRICVTVLGAGRGPLVTQALLAASFHGLIAEVTIVEKNPHAVDYLALKIACDTHWQQQRSLYGHTLHLLHCDGRNAPSKMSLNLSRADDAEELVLCDVVVSELLGSLGDNELSPECLEGFFQALQAAGQMRLPVSVPREYSSFVAPIHSAVLADEVANAVATGLHAIAFNSATGDRHACVSHNIFVVNINKGILLSPPQKLFTFAHGGGPARDDPSAHMEKDAYGVMCKSLRFTSSHTGRVDGFAGYFTALLYRPGRDSEEEEVVLSTLPGSRQPTNMFSWFPAYVSVPRRMTVVPGDSVALQVSRRQLKDEARAAPFVAFEWRVGCGAEKAVMLVNNFGWAASVELPPP